MFRLDRIRPFFIFFLLFVFTTAYGRQKHVFTQKEMGSPFTITIYTNDSSRAVLAAGKAFAEVNRLNGIFSDYVDSSELNRLCATSGEGKYVKVSPELFEILKLSLKASRISRGAFDITVGPLVRIWRKARKEKKFPDKTELEEVRPRVGYRYIHLDDAHQSVWLEKPNMQLDLGGIAKGYAAQTALGLIRKAGLPSAMVDAGGDLALGDPPPHRADWQIGIGIPESSDQIMQRKIFLKNKAVATSGDIYQYLEWKGKKYSHIINPKTGYGVTYQRNVTIIANDGAIADWLASACSILSIRQSMKLVSKFPGAGLLIAEKRGDSIYRVSTKKFSAYYQRP